MDTDIETNWKILTVDPDPIANKTIKILLEQFCFEGKSITVFKSTSLDQAKTVLSKESDIAIAFIDFVAFELKDNLKLIKYIREELHNKKIRIILKTGYPTVDTAIDLIEQYEIDGCLSKDYLSKDQFQIATITALRSYNQIMITEKVLQGLASSIAHELKNPLSSIKLGAQVIKGIIDQASSIKKQNEEGIFIPIKESEICKDLIGNIYNASIQSNIIVDIILNNIRYDVNQTGFQRLSIAEVVTQTVNAYPYYNEKEESAIKLHIDEDFEFYGNEELMIHVLFNLMRNAFYYFRNRKHGELQILSIFGKECNVLKVIDNGPGIESERIPYLFEHFVASNKKEGIGLGLPFCKRVMKSVQGDITCGSKLTKGTTFTLMFPILG